MMKRIRTLVFIAVSSMLIVSPCSKAVGLNQLFSRLKEPFTQGFNSKTMRSATGASLSVLWKIGTGVAVATILANIILPESEKNRLRQRAFWNWFVFKREPLRAPEASAVNPLDALEKRVAALETLYNNAHPDGNHTHLSDRIAALEAHGH